MHRLSPLDNSFLEIESESIQANIGGVSVFEGPPPAHKTLLRLVDAKLDLAPRYRQRVQRMPLGLGMPVWRDDEHFNLGYHVRRTALPLPGGAAELETLVGRVMSQHLDRDKPLWETWVVEGLEAGRWAIVSKVHHAMVDGVSAYELTSALLDVTPKPSTTRRRRAWQPETSGPLGLAAESARGFLAPLDQLEVVARKAREAPRELVLQALLTARAVLPIGPALTRQRHHLSLNGPIGPHRRWTRAAVSLADVKQVRRSLGGTVNDVVLALVTRGMRDLLRARGEVLDERTLRAMVPVSVRTAVQRGSLANRVSTVFAELPVGMDDPVARFADIRAQMAHVKETHGAVAGETLVGIAGFGPPVLLALGARLALRTPQRMINTVATNIPGPQVPLYLAGRRLLEAWPYVMLASTVRIATAIFSYDGFVYFGATGDYDSSPDVGVITSGITAGMAELLALSGATHPAYTWSSSSTTRTASSSAGSSNGSAGSSTSGSPRSRARSSSPPSGA